MEKKKGWFEIWPNEEAFRIAIFVYTEHEIFDSIEMELRENDCNPGTFFISSVSMSNPWVPEHREVMTMILDRVCSKDPEQVGEVIDLLRPFLYEGKPKVKVTA